MAHNKIKWRNKIHIADATQLGQGFTNDSDDLWAQRWIPRYEADQRVSWTSLDFFSLEAFALLSIHKVVQILATG